MPNAPDPIRAEDGREAGLRCACSQVPFPQSLEPGYEWRCPCGKSSMRSCAPLTAEARAARAEAEVARLTERVATALDDACRMDAIRLSVGELSPQENQLASIVAGVIVGKVRAALHGGDHAE